MKHKTFSIMLAMLISVVACGASAHDFEVNGIYYKIINANLATVAVSYGGSSPDSYSNEYAGNVIIPESVTYNAKTYSVTEIIRSAFSDCSDLTSVTIPNSVTSIGSYAFYGCSGITSVTIPEGVISIEDGVFIDCTGLTSITIPNSVTSIGQWAFRRCNSLTSITIPKRAKIGFQAFSGCSSLITITIPNSVTSIGESAFSGCSSLEAIEVEGGNPRYDSRDGCNAIIETSSNILVAGCKNTIIPSSVKAIGNDAFCGCDCLSSITIPNSVTTIGEMAFTGCCGLTSITIPNTVKSIGDGAFSGCYFLRNKFINKSSLSDSDFWGAIICAEETSDGLIIEDNTIVRCRPWATSITIPNGVTSIGNIAFSDCRSLTSLTIPNSVTSIGEGAFGECTCQTSITIPHTVKSIGKNAFSGCRGLKISLNCPTISNWFSYCDGLEITIGENVKTIVDGAFVNCKNLQRVNISDVKAWCHIDFGKSDANPITKARRLYINGEEVKKLVIPNGTERIGRHAFDGCESLMSVVIPNSVKSIGENAFQDCINLYSVTSLVNIPFKLDASAFIYTNSDYMENTIYMIATLYVPRGRESFYGQTSGWNLFTNIQPTDTKFRLTYMLDGEEYQNYEIQATEIVTPEPEPIKEGYVFSGWSEIPWYMPAENVVVYGSFTPGVGISTSHSEGFSNKPLTYYSIDGKRLIRPVKGLHITQMNDGSVKKIIVK